MSASDFSDTLNNVMNSPAFWAMAGAIGVKAIDLLIFRKKTHADVVSHAYSAVNEAQRQLVDGLFQQVSLLNDEIEKLKSQVAERDEALSEAKSAIDTLAREITLLKGGVRPEGL